MESVPGTRRGLRAVDRRYWQAKLFGHIAAAPGFKRIPAFLAPLWEQARQELGSLEVASAEEANHWVSCEFDKLYTKSQMHPLMYGQKRPCLAEYLTTLDVVLCRDLRLVWKRQPAAWAREHLHHAANPRSLLAQPGEGVAMPENWRTIRIKVSAAGAYVLRSDGKNAFILPDPDRLVFAAADWKRLRDEAERAAGEAVDDLRAWFEATSEHLGYGAAWEDLKRDCERLALVLMGRGGIRDDADRQTLRRMAARVGVDLPPRRNRTNSVA
jgi:hypothetical protein